ncbi:MAG: Holliday junction resolvase RuvX [Muribaculaceae bacterium]|nr:Holliday junction resolvase RuvX [Muribaculaceae bacterium]
MGRLLAIDYGRKRCGIAVTDILHISANGLPTVRSCDLIQFLKDYASREPVEAFIVGDPKDMHGNPSESARFLTPFLNRLKKEIPEIPVIMFDERFTSSIAHQEMISAGFKKKDREHKGKADEIAAVLILTSYLESRQNSNFNSKPV